MYVHRERRLVYLAHMRVGSQAVRDVLQRRGFESIYGHHGGPWAGRQKKFQDAGQSWWWKYGGPHFRFSATVRNHFDIIRSFWYWHQPDPESAGRRSRPPVEPLPRTAEGMEWFVDRFMWSRTPHFYNSTRLFRFTQEVPGLDIWPFEDQRESLAHYLWMNGLEELGRDEYREPDPAHTTKAKPRVPWSEEYNVETTAWVVDRFGQEMAELGYTFEGLYPNFRRRR